MEEGQTLYIYGIIPVEEVVQASLAPFETFSNDQFAVVYTDKGITYEEYYQVLSRLHSTFTLLPMPYGTMYSSLAECENVLHTYKEQIEEKHRLIKGRDEWTFIIYTDDSAWEYMMDERYPEIERQYKELEELPAGERFFEKKKIEKTVVEAIEMEKAKVCQRLHMELMAISDGYIELDLLSRQESGLTDDMVWHGTYLISCQSAEGLVQMVDEWSIELKSLGIMPECKGPFPAVTFAKLPEQF
ncbi:GvpL/GvpF family gas vesicle protein [Bacillus tianshenii]|nr:GvpL/GvpF family gas vesicle protein [Bacillus tianshenii]